MSGQRAAGPGPKKRGTISIRILPSELAQIDRAAKKQQLTRTDYMIRAALGQLNAKNTEERLRRLEAHAFGDHRKDTDLV